MTHTEIEKAFNKVHEQNKDWETKGNAFFYAQQLWGEALHCIGDTKDTDPNTLAKQTYDMLHQTGCLAKCLTDNFRRLVISHHARGLTTSQTINLILPDEMLKDITPFHVFKFANVCGYDNIKNFLLMRISYLKPTDPRWPHKKYGEYWKKERQQYREAISDMPLIDIKEQIAGLSEHYAMINTRINESFETIDFERLHRCKLQTIAAINILSQTTEMGIHQKTIFQKNMTNSLLNAISGADHQLQPHEQKQLTSTKQEQLTP